MNARVCSAQNQRIPKYSRSYNSIEQAETRGNPPDWNGVQCKGEGR